jgi:hypothetical protein
MSKDYKLIYGVRTSGTVTLTVNGSPTANPPALHVRTLGGTEATIPYANTRWSATLQAGDHVIWMTPSNDTWFDGEVVISSNPESQFIGCHKSEGCAKTWRATSFVVEDPKDPGSPPTIAATAAASNLPTSAWITDTMRQLINDASVARDGHDLSAMVAQHNSPT